MPVQAAADATNSAETGREEASMDDGRPMRGRSKSSIFLGVLGVATLCMGNALTQEHYPSKPVKIIVGMPAGTFTDLSARLIGESLRANLGETFIIENRPGAATNIATQAAVRAPKDGYTLLLSSNSNAMNVSLFKELTFDVVRDLAPIAMIAATSFILSAAPSFPASNLRELIAYAKIHPGELNFASTGAGTANHLAVAMLAKQADIKLTTVFYKGSAEGIADIIGGRTHAMFAPVSTAMPQIEAGKLKALAVTGRTRSALAPDVPTMAEAGVPGYEVAMWTGLSAPAGTPSDVIDRLAAAAIKGVASAEFRSKIKSNGGDPIIMGPKEFADYLQADIRRWSDAIEAAGIKPQ
jgi:tripartite-type tricarboxylate transporter receptor subunit TctC